MMSEHNNRLNKEESLKWDKAWKKFCETGVWEEPNESLSRRKSDREET